MSEREIVLISGMHRSGTSALARVVDLLGATLPEPLVPPSLGNELGHWEPAEVVEMNDRALLAAGADVNGLHALSPEWAQSPAADAFVEEIGAYLVRVAPPGARIAIKDPRIALLTPYWRAGVERAGARPRFVLAFRDPWEVARSLSTRQLQHFPDEIWPHGRVIALWLKHHLEMERATRGVARSFVGYADMLGDWRAQARRMFDQLDLGWIEPDRATTEEIDAFVRPDARRQRRARGDREPKLAAQVLALLRARRADPDGGDAAFDAAGSVFDASLDLLGDYLRALEARIGRDDDTRRRADDAEAMIAALREAVERAELAAVARMAALAPPEAEAAPADADLELERSHAALKLAQRRTAAALRTGRAAWDAERARLLAAAQDADARADEAERDAATARRTALATAIAEARAEAERAGRMVAAAWDAERERLAAAAVEAREEAERARRVAAEGWDAERDRLEVELTGLRRAATSAARDADAERETERARCKALDDAIDRLASEVADHRAAYEALREEATQSRAQADQARTEAASEKRLREGEQARADAANDHADALAGEMTARDARLGESANALAAARAEAEALRRSSSWRLTRPFRSIAFRVRRL